jgi:hypothetical protein
MNYIEQVDLIKSIHQWRVAMNGKRYRHKFSHKLITEELGELYCSVTDEQCLDGLADVLFIAVSDLGQMGIKYTDIHKIIAKCLYSAQPSAEYNKANGVHHPNPIANEKIQIIKAALHVYFIRFNCDTDLVWEALKAITLSNKTKRQPLIKWFKYGMFGKGKYYVSPSYTLNLLLRLYVYR